MWLSLKYQIVNFMEVTILVRGKFQSEEANRTQNPNYCLPVLQYPHSWTVVITWSVKRRLWSCLVTTLVVMDSSVFSGNATGHQSRSRYFKVFQTLTSNTKHSPPRWTGHTGHIWALEIPLAPRATVAYCLGCHHCTIQAQAKSWRTRAFFSSNSRN